jgi:hypothetical protein
VARPASAAGELRDDCYPARCVASATCIFRASAVVPIVAPGARRSIADLDAVTIPELAERIEERLGELRHEIIRLQAANEALASTRTDAAAAQPVPDLRAPARGSSSRCVIWVVAAAPPTRPSLDADRSQPPSRRSPASWTLGCATAPDPRRRLPVQVAAVRLAGPPQPVGVRRRQIVGGAGGAGRAVAVKGESVL